MRIVELVNNLEFGGTERLVVNLSRALSLLGHQVSVVCLRQRGALAGELQNIGIEVFPLEKPEGPDLSALRRFVAYLKRERVDVVHTHNPLVHHYGVVGGKLASVPCVVSTIHGIGNLSDRRGVKELLYALCCQFSEQVVAVCPMAYRYFVAQGVIPKSRLITVNNGIPLDSFVQVPARVPDGRTVFGIVGRLVPVKDHASLLHAFARVVRERPECRLEILGDGPERPRLEQLCQQLALTDTVTFHGFSDAVAEFLGRIDIAVLCSVSEGLPLGILEAMAAGLPIVGTAVGGLPDLTEGAQCGWLSPPSNPERLADALLAAAATPAAERARMGQRARAMAIAEYSLARMTDEYVALFQKYVAARGARADAAPAQRPSVGKELL